MGQLPARELAQVRPDQIGVELHLQDPPVLGPTGYVFSVRVRCAECGSESDDDARGWVALLGYDPREDEFPSAFVFCPDCAQREFELGPESPQERDRQA
jgi:hypothetical protein